MSPLIGIVSRRDNRAPGATPRTVPISVSASAATMARRARELVVEALARDVQHRAHSSHRPDSLVLGDEGEPYSTFRAKNAVAFLRCHATPEAGQPLCAATHLGLLGPHVTLAGKECCGSAAACFTQRWSTFSCTSRSRTA